LVLVAATSIPFLPAVPLRVVTFNIEANRDQNGDVTEALNDPGTADYNAVRDVLQRIDADVVCLQELANADVSGGTDGGTNSDVHALASELGLPHVFIPTNAGVFGFALRNAVISRHPFLDIAAVGSSSYQESIGAVGSNGERAKDVTRVIPAMVIDVPDAAAPLTLCTLHNKSSTGPDDRFRRAVELARLRDYLERNDLDANDNIVVTGDFNLSAFDDAFSTEPNGLPSTWNRGTDIPLPISYSTDPDFYFPAPYHLFALDAQDVSGGRATFQTANNDITLDYILPSPALITRGSEIYRSDLDTNNTQGLAKEGSPLPSAVSFQASDHFAVFADFELENAIPPATSYVLTAADSQVDEDFSNFEGFTDPEPWSSINADWLGPFGTTANLPQEPAAFATAWDEARAVGVTAGTEATTFSAIFDNETGGIISALNFSYLASVAIARPQGSQDELTVSFNIGNGEPTLLPGLTFVAQPSVTAPVTQQLSTTQNNLAIAPGQSFRIDVTATKLEPPTGNANASVFLNEFHYENSSSDEGEFVEIIVGPGFEGNLNTIELILYNGSSTQLKPYETIALSEFDSSANPTVVNGYRIFHDFIAGIQNGPDGFALVVDGEVVEFLSYEGSFQAAEGPAAGMISRDIGVSQASSTPPGFGSLALTGNGLAPEDFTWTALPNDIPHSPGQPNPGQKLIALPQVMAFDSVTVEAVLHVDSDNDGLPDAIETSLNLDPSLQDSDDDGIDDGDEDFDRDGQSNASEVLITGTDPADASSRFTVQLLASEDGLALSFETLPGRSYRILGGESLPPTSSLETISGDGQAIVRPLTPGQATQFFSVEVSLEP
jgi:endonuclease/exonuclease/phosphatase family metal-dependent hydrolase